MYTTHVLQFTTLFYLMHLIFCEYPILLPSSSGSSDRIANSAECVLKLSAKYFVEKKALSGSIVIININSYSSTTQMLLLRTIHDGIKYSVMVKDSFYPHANASHFPEKAKNYMLILEEKSELTRNILQLNKLPTWNPHAKAIIFYKLKTNENGEKIAIEFINQLRMYKLLKTIVLICSFDYEEVVSYSWKPYSETNCGGECKSVYVLDRCRERTIAQIQPLKEIYPSNMNKCPLVVYAVVAEPYVLSPRKKLDDAEFNDVFEFTAGGEINLVKIISEFTNMTLIIRTSATPENWGYIDFFGNATGAYSYLRNDSVDVIIGNIEVTRTLRKWFDPTVIYTQDEMTWCVPKAGQAPTWDNLAAIFQWSTWLATIVSYILMGLLFHYFYYKEHMGNITKWPTNSLLMTLSMLLGWGASFGPKATTFRILISFWLFFCILMGITYEAFLRGFLMHPRFEKQIDSEAELIQSGIPLGGREIYRAYFETNNASSFYLYRKYNSTFFSEGIKRVALDKDFAVVSSRKQAMYQDQELGKGAPLIYCFPESHNLYKYGVVLLTRKWFPLLERFNNVIRSVSENGFIDKWSSELFKHMINADDTGSVVPLGVQHLLGAFMLIGFMYGASVLVFLGELIFDYVNRRKIKN